MSFQTFREHVRGRRLAQGTPAFCLNVKTHRQVGRGMSPQCDFVDRFMLPFQLYCPRQHELLKYYSRWNDEKNTGVDAVFLLWLLPLGRMTIKGGFKYRSSYNINFSPGFTKEAKYLPSSHGARGRGDPARRLNQPRLAMQMLFK